MKQLMKISDLRRIVDGEGEFSFEKRIRKEELLHLEELVSDPHNRMDLILADDVDVASIERKLRDYDSQFTIDEKITVWRSHAGRISWSDDVGCIAQHGAVLNEFERLATYKSTRQVCDQLAYYAEMIQ